MYNIAPFIFCELMENVSINYKSFVLQLITSHNAKGGSEWTWIVDTFREKTHTNGKSPTSNDSADSLSL